MAERSQFDHYEILTREDGSLFELGRGAMGITYKAFDTNLRVPVALKVINAGNLDNDSARQRFVTEARASAMLRHRHVASVFHLGLTGEDYFYAMEFIDGESVDELVKRKGRLAPRLAIELAIQVARALGAAQKHHLVHRDIKPANLMLVNEDDEVWVKVIDFGLAKSLHRETEAAAMTVAGFVGTPHFASPEQLEEKDIDVRSDIYSLGATLWFMLSGQPPFAGTLAQVISNQLSTPPPVETLATFPESVRPIIRKMLAKDPGTRHQTPQELRRALDSALEKLPEDVEAPGSVDEEVAAEAIADETARAAERPFAVGDTVANTYEILEDRGEGAHGDIFRARRVSSGESVRLVAVSPALLAEPKAYSSLEREVERAQGVRHKNVLGVYGLERTEEQTLLTLEWTTGFSLVELLRARRELETTDALPLLARLASGADHAAENNLSRVDFALHQILVHFPELEDSAAARTYLRRPVAEWPAYEIKLNPIGFSAQLSLSDTWAGGQTIVGGIATPAAGAAHDLSGRYVQAVSAVAYELLGGTARPGADTGGSSRYVPLATLSEQGNDILKRASHPSSDFHNARELVHALDESEQHATKRNASRSTAAGLQTLARVAERAEREAWETRNAPLSNQPKQRPFPVILAVGAGVFVLFLLLIIILPLFTGNVPGDAVKGPPAVEPVTAGDDESEPAPPPGPTRDELLKDALAQAQKYESDQNWQEALAAYLAISRDFPESAAGRVQLELMLEGIRKDKRLSQGDFTVLRDQITSVARLDVVSAMMLLGEYLRETEPKIAFDWYTTAAARGNAEAHTQVGLMYSNGAGVPRDLQKAVWWFEEAARRGDPAGLTCLGECYLNGKGTRRDPARAAEILQEAVDKGEPRAMNLLGTLYHRGIGVETDFGKALQLFTLAVENNHLDALGNLGVLHINGEGVPRDTLKAVNLFQEGSRKGNAYCMFLYARCLESGTGISPNAAEATAWYQKAAALGHPGAIAWCRQNDVEVPDA